MGNETAIISIFLDLFTDYKVISILKSLSYLILEFIFVSSIFKAQYRVLKPKYKRIIWYHVQKICIICVSIIMLNLVLGKYIVPMNQYSNIEPFLDTWWYLGDITLLFTVILDVILLVYILLSNYCKYKERKHTDTQLVIGTMQILLVIIITIYLHSLLY